MSINGYTKFIIEIYCVFLFIFISVFQIPYSSKIYNTFVYIYIFFSQKGNIYQHITVSQIRDLFFKVFFEKFFVNNKNKHHIYLNNYYPLIIYL